MFIYFDNTRNCMFKHTDRIRGKRWRLMDFDPGSDSDDLSKKSLKLDLYVHALEEEMNKIEAFKRELPNCMQLLKEAIERLKEERGREAMRNYEGDGRVKASNGVTEKKNWMNSVQLYTPVSRNQDSVSHLIPRFVEGEGSGSRNDLGCRFRNQGGAFMPFKKASGAVKEEQGTAVADGLSIAAVEAEVAPKDQAKLEEPQQQEQQKKQRRCWSPELHKIFVEALHQLGGAQSATPKQIREIMKVDGLTNDEVKSHLQKYRIHIRRVDQARSSSGLEQFAVSGSPQGPLNGGKAAATGGDSIEDEEEGKSESNGWNSKFEKAL